MVRKKLIDFAMFSLYCYKHKNAYCNENTNK